MQKVDSEIRSNRSSLSTKRKLRKERVPLKKTKKIDCNSLSTKREHSILCVDFG